MWFHVSERNMRLFGSWNISTFPPCLSLIKSMPIFDRFSLYIFLTYTLLYKLASLWHHSSDRLWILKIYKKIFTSIILQLSSRICVLLLDVQNISVCRKRNVSFHWTLGKFWGNKDRIISGNFHKTYMSLMKPKQ